MDINFKLYHYEKVLLCYFKHVGKNNLPVEDDTARGKYPGKGAYALNNIQAGISGVSIFIPPTW